MIDGALPNDGEDDDGSLMSEVIGAGRFEVEKEGTTNLNNQPLSAVPTRQAGDHAALPIVGECIHRACASFLLILSFCLARAVHFH
mmetsp:Transcript_56094/g.109812  ORF Transcript_56094/g.109812 Transcript_56094/m.109812 type:complete len:86 (-) Transcript_56094:163-420(-)